MNKMMVPRTVLAAATLLLFSAVSHPAQAQALARLGARGGMGYFQGGVHFLDLDEFNAALRAHGYPGFNDTFASVGGGGHVFFGNWLVGAEGHAALVGDETTGDRTRKLSLLGGHGLINLGYRALRGPRWNLYPLLGLGAGGFQFAIREGSQASFGQVLDDPGRETRLVGVSLLAQPALGLDLFIPVGSAPEGPAGIVVGLRAGYALSTKVGDWHEGGDSIGDGPDLDFTGPFVRLVLGGGAFRSSSAGGE